MSTQISSELIPEDIELLRRFYPLQLGSLATRPREQWPDTLVRHLNAIVDFRKKAQGVTKPVFYGKFCLDAVMLSAAAGPTLWCSPDRDHVSLVRREASVPWTPDSEYGFNVYLTNNEREASCVQVAVTLHACVDQDVETERGLVTLPGGQTSWAVLVWHPDWTETLFYDLR